MFKQIILILAVVTLFIFLIGCQEEVTEPLVENEPASLQDFLDKENVKTYRIKITDNGFEPPGLNIKVGETVEWENVRKNTKAQVIGTKQCYKVKSQLLQPGEKFNYTFNVVEPCTIVDVVVKGSINRITVED